MQYVILIALGVLVLEYSLAKYVIVGLIIPMTAAMGMIMAFFTLIMAGEGAGKDPFLIQSLLLFLFLAAVSFLIYYRRRRQEYREGYMNEDQYFKDKVKTDIEKEQDP